MAQSTREATIPTTGNVIVFLCTAEGKMVKIIKWTFEGLIFFCKSMKYVTVEFDQWTDYSTIIRFSMNNSQLDDCDYVQ